MEKLIIYQAFPRIFTNTNDSCVPSGTYEQNGSGKLRDLTLKLLRSLKDMGVNTIWLTGIIEMATKTAFDDGRIPADNPNVVKGEAGSPYAIKDYYDVAPSLATETGRRMKEFEATVRRVHSAGLKLIIDFVPNHTSEPATTSRNSSPATTTIITSPTRGSRRRSTSRTPAPSPMWNSPPRPPATTASQHSAARPTGTRP